MLLPPQIITELPASDAARARTPGDRVCSGTPNLHTKNLPAKISWLKNLSTEIGRTLNHFGSIIKFGLILGLASSFGTRPYLDSGVRQYHQYAHYVNVINASGYASGRRRGTHQVITLLNLCETG